MTDHRPLGDAGPNAAIELAAPSKTYRRRKDTLTAVRPTTLSVPWGQVIGLLGPNGAGKTTIIKMTAGLITPTTGTIRIGGHDIRRDRAAAVRLIGAVLEGSRNVYWPMSAWENLMYFGRLKGLRGAEIKPRAKRLLTDLGLWDRRGEVVGGYSRGMQQKVAVAAALITDPQILLLDEPTLGLDVESARTFKEWIAKLAREEGKTIVLTTHQLNVAQELSDRIAVIKAGEIIADLPTAELLAWGAEDHFEVRVDAPPDSLTVPLPVGVRIRRNGRQTRIVLPDADTASLYDLLERLREAEVPLMAVDRAEPDLEEVFIRLVHDAGEKEGAA